MWQCNCPAARKNENNSFFKAAKRKYKLLTIFIEFRPSRELFSGLVASLGGTFQSGTQIQGFQVGKESAEEVLVWTCF